MAGKLTFAPNLYLGESIASEKLDKIKKRLVKNPLWANVYLITPASNPADQLDIFDARQLIQPHYKNEEFLVPGNRIVVRDPYQTEQPFYFCGELHFFGIFLPGHFVTDWEK